MELATSVGLLALLCVTHSAGQPCSDNVYSVSQNGVPVFQVYPNHTCACDTYSAHGSTVTSLSAGQAVIGSLNVSGTTLAIGSATLSSSANTGTTWGFSTIFGYTNATGYQSPHSPDVKTTVGLVVNGNLQVAGSIQTHGWRRQIDLYHFQSGTLPNFTCNSVQMKTNIPYDAESLYRFDILGYHYGLQSDIDCSLMAYTYGYIARPVVIHRSLVRAAINCSQYVSADYYVSIEAALGPNWSAGFTLSAMQVGATTIGGPIEVTTSSYPNCTRY